jgi:N-acetylmuramoyl-L-alanine amidase
MRSYFAQLKGVALAVSLAVAVPLAQAQAPAGNLDADALRAAVQQALGVAPRDYQALLAPAQTGVRLLALDVQRTSPSAQRITIDLSQRALTYDPSGAVEALTDHVIESTAALTGGAGDVEYRILIDGLPLDQFVPRGVAPGRIERRQLGAPGRVVVSAGHGWYRHESSGEWRLQRDYFWGIVEDFVNYDIVRYLTAELKAARLDVWPARNPDPAAGPGASGHGRWEESAKYYIREMGAPPSVWDYGVNDYAKDINSRPFFANWVDSAVIVSIHNNGGGGTGTETWYDATNGHDAESRRLARIVNDRIVAAIRSHYDPNWPDRGLRTCNGCKGETRLAGRPAILVEVAFMDMKTPDNDALHDERFKWIVARAIREGLQEWGLRAPAGDGDAWIPPSD